MMIGWILLSSAAGGGLTTYAYQLLKKRREQRIRSNENKAATTIRDYARSVKTYLEDTRRKGVTIDSQRIAVPKSAGYQLSLELSAQAFRVYGVPRRHNKTGRLSFYADNSLIVKAADKGGDSATEKDDAFNRITAEVMA